MATPWTAKHEREALRRTYEIAAELVTSGGPAKWVAELATGNVISEEAWRGLLRPGNAGFDDARIECEVKRIRARAEGREEVTVIEQPFFRVRFPDGSYEHKVTDRSTTDRGEAYRTPHRKLAKEMADGLDDACVVRVTVTRRRYLRAPVSLPVAQAKPAKVQHGGLWRNGTSAPQWVDRVVVCEHALRPYASFSDGGEEWVAQMLSEGPWQYLGRGPDPERRDPDRAKGGG